MKMHWRPLITVLVLLIWAPYLFADEFEIRNFKKDPSDYTAARSGRNDINGQACAILKVRTDLTGLSFECNQGFTGDPEYKTGEVWLYLSPKEKRIKFMKEGFIPKDFLFTEAIESATVYMIELTNKFKTGTQVILSMGFVLIKSTPAGAEVNLNGEPTGMKTPFSKALPLGNHQLILKKELYLPNESNFEITAGNTTTLEIPLTANFGSLTISTQPESGAEVWIDGQSAGETTPATMEMLSAGNHFITVKKEMYEALEQEFAITSGRETALNLTLVPTFGTISISTTPPADIWIDQSRIGTGTYSGRLLKGLHMVEATLDKHKTITESVTVEIDKPLSLKWQMVPKTGTLAINSDPPEADVYLDGTLQGTSPLFIEKIIVGGHSIRFTKTGHGEVIKQVSLQENQTLDINEKLPAGIEVTINSTPSEVDLYIDNKPTGKTPYIGPLSFGSHTLRIENNGEKDEKNVQVIQGGTVSFSLAIMTIGIGQQFGGGIIFYIDGTGNHGLIASPTDQSVGAQWGCYPTSTKETSIAIGKGKANTKAIVNECSETGIAARICDNLVLNGYSDWFLPSKDELNQIFLNKNFIGGFANGYYWSSSENISKSTSNYTWNQFFGTGGQGYATKNTKCCVRAIRAF